MDHVIDMQLTASEYAEFAHMIETRFGIQLPPEKRGLVQSRLQKLVRQSGQSSFSEFFRTHIRNPSRQMLSEVIDRIATNHTYFWREPEHLEHFRDVLVPEQARNPGRDLRVWCAAAATGEEPYGIAMMEREALGSDYSNWRAGLLATDISEGALNRARVGVFSPQSVTALPTVLRNRYLERRVDGRFAVREALRQDVTYRRLNLLNDAFPFRAKFHAVFCRNVMIYFDLETRRALVQRIMRYLEPDGVLYIGMSETLQGRIPGLKSERPGVYRFCNGDT